MVKSVKAIILASVMVSMSVMLINSCGVSSPTASTGNTGVAGPLAAQTAPAALTLNPANKSPLPPVLADIASKSPAAIPFLFNASVVPHLNPNASSPNKKPFSSICGIYSKWYCYAPHNPILWYFNNGRDAYGWVDLWCRIDYPDGNTFKSWIVTDYHQLIPPPLPPTASWSIPCNLFPPGMDPLLPDDLFTGNGLPAGLYAMPDGSVWEIGIGANGNPVITDHGKQLDPKTGQPLYPPGYYPPAGGTNPPATQPPGNNPPANNPPPPASGATLASLTVYTTTPTVSAGTKAQFNVIGTMSDGSTDPTVTNSVVVWHSDNPAVATIDNNGLATTLTEGTANITATYRGLVSNPIPLTVNPPELTTITVSPARTTIYVHPIKGTQQYIATGTYSDGSRKLVASPVTWDTLPGGIVSINNTGKAMAVSQGTTYITAASESITSGMYDAELEVLYYNYVHFLQIDPSWTQDAYAGHIYAETQILKRTEYNTALGNVPIWDGSIGRFGCTMTSVAMGLSTLGAYINPHKLNIDMRTLGYYDKKNEVDFNALKDFSNGNIIGIRYPDASQIKTELDKANIVIVQVKYYPTSATYGHWVILEKYKGDTYYSYDPTWGERTFTSLSDFNQVVVGITKY